MIIIIIRKRRRRKNNNNGQRGINTNNSGITLHLFIYLLPNTIAGSNRIVVAVKAIPYYIKKVHAAPSSSIKLLK